MTTVLIVDDHAGFRRAARRALEAAGWQVVGEAADGASGLRAAREARPDVVLLDIQLPDASGIDLSAQISAGPDAPRVVLTSTRESDDVEPLLPASGARGFVPKDQLSAAAVNALL